LARIEPPGKDEERAAAEAGRLEFEPVLRRIADIVSPDRAHAAVRLHAVAIGAVEFQAGAHAIERAPVGGAPVPVEDCSERAHPVPYSRFAVTGQAVPDAGLEPATFGLQNRCSTS